MSNADGIFTSKTSTIQNWVGDLTRPSLKRTEAHLQEIHRCRCNLYHSEMRSNENKVNGVDYAGSAFLSKYISAAEAQYHLKLAVIQLV